MRSADVCGAAPSTSDTVLSPDLDRTRPNRRELPEADVGSGTSGPVESKIFDLIWPTVV